MVVAARVGPLLPVHTDVKVLHHEQDAGDDREQAGNPDRDGKSDQEVQAEDEEEEGEKEMGHGARGLQILFRSDS
jgi:hypothetical protein